jgi:methyl-accepting chemotaxis protein
VLPKRATRDDDQAAPNNNPDLDILTAETLRNSANNSEVQLHSPGGDGGKSGEEKVSIFWRIFGGTILSIVCLVIISAYQSLTGTLKDLNGEINQLKESKADFVKKDDFAASRTKIWDRFTTDGQQIQAMTTTLATVKNDLGRQDQAIKDEVARLAGSIKSLQDEKREILASTQAAVGQVRDRQTAFEQQLRTAEQSLKAVEQQLKAVEQCARDIQAANVALSALQAASTTRELQVKQAEEQRAELCKAVAELRERLAKLEVAVQSKPPAAPAKPAAKTTAQKGEEDPDGR